MQPLDAKTKDGLLTFLEERFGLTSLAGYAFFALGKGRVHLATREAAAAAARLPAVVAGLPCARLSEGATVRFKPATALLQLFGPQISKGCVELTDAQAREFIAGRDITVAEPGAADGFVAVRSRGHVLGCGLLKQLGPPSQSDPSGQGIRWLKSQVPRAKRIGL